MRSAQFSPDGKRIVTASQDNTARVWDAQTGQPLTEPMKHDTGCVQRNSVPMGSESSRLRGTTQRGCGMRRLASR